MILPKIEDLSRLIGERIGLDFPRRKWDMLQRVVEELALELNFAGPRPLLEELLYSSLSESRLNLLIARLTVGETYFLRDKNVFTTLRDHIFPALIERKASEQRLDLWCAASSSGEEPYSIAMLLDEKEALLENWQINIRASDINLEVLEKAKKGVYSRWSLRATPESISRKYFTAIGANQFLLSRHIREMVSFYQLNLAEREFKMPGSSGRLADIIFCRNVLIYFSAELQAQVIKRLVSLLRPGGWLLVAPSELGVVSDPELTQVGFPGVIVHQKVDGSKAVPAKVKNRSSSRVRASIGLVSARAHSRRRQDKKMEPTRVPAKRALDQGGVPVSLKEVLARVTELFHRESYREALDLIPEVVDLSLQEVPEYAQVMALKARLLANLGELEAAAAAVELALEADKVEPFFYYLSASIARE
ncbi:MAG: protein-glutamate O-methyltransferase CheR, partial [Pseudomonadota bacterium]|nr:protein-glutamate O-methyltransferase CheR [Pseudomonadota bacterium]